MKRTITWYMSGLQSQKEAEERLTVMKTWFNSSFKADEWSVDASVGNNHFGWFASLEATMQGVTQ